MFCCFSIPRYAKRKPGSGANRARLGAYHVVQKFYWGYMGFYWLYTPKQTKTKCGHDLRAPCGVSHVFIFTLRPAAHTHLLNHGYLIAGKTRIAPTGAPCRDKDGAGSGISGLYLWLDVCCPQLLYCPESQKVQALEWLANEFVCFRFLD